MPYTEEIKILAMEHVLSDIKKILQAACSLGCILIKYIGILKLSITGPNCCFCLVLCMMLMQIIFVALLLRQLCITDKHIVSINTITLTLNISILPLIA